MHDVLLFASPSFEMFCVNFFLNKLKKKKELKISEGNYPENLGLAL